MSWDPVPTEKELALFRHIYAKAAQLLAQDGGLQPVAFFRVGPAPRMQGPKPGMIVPVQMDMPGNDQGKDVLAEILRDLTRKLDADLVLLVLESWMVKPDPAEAEYMMREGCFPVRPSQHPNRIEIVLFALEKPGGQQWSCWVEIQRDANRRPVIPVAPPPLEHLQSEGRFGNLFPADAAEARVMTDGPASTSRN